MVELNASELDLLQTADVAFGHQALELEVHGQNVSLRAGARRPSSPRRPSNRKLCRDKRRSVVRYGRHSSFLRAGFDNRTITEAGSGAIPARGGAAWN